MQFRFPSILLVLLCMALLALPAPGAAQTIAQTAAPTFATQFGVPNTTPVKFPALAASGSTVQLAASVRRFDANVWAMQSSASDFGAPTRLGPAEGQPDYSTTTITVGPDRTWYAVWVNQPERTVYLRTLPPGATAWTAPSIVVSGQPFPVLPQVIVASDGAVFVTWRNPDRPFSWRRSIDGGRTWGPIGTLGRNAGVNIASLAAGPNGAVAVAFTAGEGDLLQIFVGLWNGVSFDITRVSAFNSSYADPTVTIAPDGRVLVAWRGVVRTGFASGFFFAERQADGSWPVARLASGDLNGRAWIVADAQNNLHALWLAAVNGPYQFWYAVLPSGGAAWQGPVAAPATGGTLFNAAATVATDAAGVQLLAASEVFFGEQVAVRVARFAAGLFVAPQLAATAPTTPVRPGAPVELRLEAISGAPSEVRVAWGAAPTDAAPWQPFAAIVDATAPTVSGTACHPATAFVQARNAGGQVSEPVSVSVQIDPAVQARVELQAANVAAPGYTNQPQIGVVVSDVGECSGLATIRPALDGVSPAEIRTTPYTLELDLPGDPGRYERAIEITDRAGNLRTTRLQVRYDPIAPTASYTGTLEVRPNPTATVLQQVTFSGAQYRDDEGMDVLPWGVAVLVSRQPIDPENPTGTWRVFPLPAGQTAWSAAPTPAERTVQVAAEVSLATFLPRSALTPGDYHYAVALVDRAGNRSATALTGSITLDAVTYPRTYLPLVQR
jgi:hypothetical protein